MQPPLTHTHNAETCLDDELLLDELDDELLLDELDDELLLLLDEDDELEEEELQTNRQRHYALGMLSFTDLVPSMNAI
jgi:hypothetical protein